MGRCRTSEEMRLSGLQQSILIRLGALTHRMQIYGDAAAQAQLDSWGVLWTPGRGDPHWTPAKRVSCSRALRRLEWRGLVVRRNRRGSPVKRTTHVQLSLRGEIAVQRLTAQARRDVNRIFRQLERRRRALVRRRRRKPSVN